MIRVAVSQIIEAPADRLYAVITDYQVGHAAILPRPYFQGMTVKRGGRGAGTILHLEMKVFGQRVTMRQEVSEPEPGRVVEERDLDSDLVTTFTFDPLANGQQTRVTITTLFPSQAGLLGLMDRLTRPMITRHIYRQELQNLADYVRAKSYISESMTS